MEFAILLPVLLLILFGIIEYGWLLTNQVVLSNAVSAGARFAVKNEILLEEDPESFQLQVADLVTYAFWPKDIDAGLVSVLEDTPEEGMVEVRVTDLVYKSITGYLPAALLPEHLGARAVMVFP